MKEKNHMVLSTDAEKLRNKIQYHFLIKNIQQPMNRGKLPQQNKGQR